MSFRKLVALLIGSKFFLLTSLEADALQCYSCYTVETPSNWEHNESVALFPFDFTCGIDSRPNPKLLVDCDEWAKGLAINITNLDKIWDNKSASSTLQTLFNTEKAEVGIISWTCATFSFDGKMKESSYNSNDFKGTYRTCFAFGNTKKNECKRGRLEGVGDKFEALTMKFFMKSLSNAYFTPDTESIACTCLEDGCNKDLLEETVVGNLASIICGFEFVPFFLGGICFHLISKILTTNQM